jgi:hypothetical protein
MAAGKYSFTIEKGSTTQFEIQYVDANNTPIDLSGITARMQIKDTRPGETATTFLSLTSSLAPGASYSNTVSGSFLSVSGSDLTTDLISGSIGVYIGYGVTDSFEFKKGVYDIELTSGPIRIRLLEGNILVKDQVTTI